MLTIYIKGQTLPEGLDVRGDTELEFARIQVKDTEYTRKAIKEIEKGEYYNEVVFTDRFKGNLYYSEMSTGCKAAIVVGTNPNIVLDLRECGLNAIDFIVANCRDGNILILPPDNPIGLHREPEGYVDSDIDVCIDGERFFNSKDLNEYLLAE